MGIAVTRGAANSLSFCYCLLLLTVCKNLITKLKEHSFHQVGIGVDVGVDVGVVVVLVVVVVVVVVLFVVLVDDDAVVAVEAW